MVFGWFRRKKKDAAAAAAPHWATFLTLVQQQRVEALVLDWFRRRGDTPQLGEGFVKVGELQYGLENVAQRCRPLPPDEWPLCVEEHFGAIAAAESDQREWDQQGSDFDWAAPRLRLRLYHPDYVAEGRGDFMLHRVDVPHTCSALVADLPTAVVSVTVERLGAWRRDRDEVFALALRQTLQECPIEWERVPFGKAGRQVVLHVASAEHFFVCSHVLALDRWPDVLGEHGALVGLPDRQTMVVLPLATAGGEALVAAVGQLANLVAERHHGSPGSVSPHLYWWQPGSRSAPQLALQESRSTAGKVVLVPVPELVAALDRIAAG